MRDWDPDEHPRWPAHTGRGGQFRGVGTPGVGSWVATVAGRLTRGWANDDLSRHELYRIAESPPDGTPEELYGGNTAETYRYDLPDGRSVIKKVFTSARHRSSQGRAEVVSSLVADAIGVRVPPVAAGRTPGIIWMGFVDGETGYNFGEDFDELPNPRDLDPSTRKGLEVWRMSLLDMLIGNDDRHAGNVMTTPDGRLVGIDHGEARIVSDRPPATLAEYGVPMDDWRRAWYSRLRWENGKADVELGPNPLHPDDPVVLTRRLHELYRNGYLSEREYRYAAQILGFLAVHATGTVRLVRD